MERRCSEPEVQCDEFRSVPAGVSGSRRASVGPRPIRGALTGCRMSPLELAATLFTVVSVVLCVQRNIWLYPTGVVGTALYLGVFLSAHLYFSTVLQVFFIVVQFYGWWYWLRGDHGHAPRITRLGVWRTIALTVAVVAVSLVIGWWAGRATAAASSLADASLTGASLLAQFLQDRKKLENWLVWAVVDVISTATYYGQGLQLTAALYAGLLVMTAWGAWEWWKELKATA
jgi:nicotinamide mononucleotide transporter